MVQDSEGFFPTFADSSGGLEVKEMNRVAGRALSKSHAAGLIKLMDSDGNKAVDFEEFSSFMTQIIANSKGTVTSGQDLFGLEIDLPSGETIPLGHLICRARRRQLIDHVIFSKGSEREQKVDNAAKYISALRRESDRSTPMTRSQSRRATEEELPRRVGINEDEPSSLGLPVIQPSSRPRSGRGMLYRLSLQNIAETLRTSQSSATSTNCKGHSLLLMQMQISIEVQALNPRTVLVKTMVLLTGDWQEGPNL